MSDVYILGTDMIKFPIPVATTSSDVAESTEILQVIDLRTGDVVHWLELFAQPFLNAAASASDRSRLLNDVRAQLAPRIQNADGVWVVDYVRLRFAAIRPL